MLDVLKVWWVILTQVGPIGKSSRAAEQWMRYYVIEALREEGLFDYLQEARNYGQIIAHLGFVDSSYTREVLETLATEKHNVLVKQGDRYGTNPRVPLPTLGEARRRAPQHFDGLTMWRDFARRIPARMRREPVDFVHRFEQEGPAVFSFDRSLNQQIFAALRKAAFAYVSKRALRGVHLLDVACGSGYETGDLWVWLKGDVQITAVDPVPGLLDLAEDHFVEAVSAKGRLGVAPLTDANRPTFHLMNAIDLDFPDESFDAVFHSTLLHWTPDPARAIQEMGRVLKPGGLVFGTQVTKPLTSPYIGLIVQVHENVYGFFWEEEFRRWYERAGVTLSIATPAGVFKGRKTGRRARLAARP
jgi:ubiquinone/menaquinone biosynthesis C-methylase UbiE